MHLESLEKRNLMKYASDFKKDNQKITMVTCYDYSFAKILNDSDIDAILVGDSLGMVIYGHSDTLKVSLEMMVSHTEAVRRGAPNKFIVADMPFLSTRKGLEIAMDSAHSLMKAGANAIKVEGVRGQEKIILAFIEAGIPVMGHLGLTPQYYQNLGGFKVQGKGLDAEEELIAQSRVLTNLGVFSIVLECVPSFLASKIQTEVDVPIIGIGAGVNVCGQVLVLNDLLGITEDKFKFVRHFSCLKKDILTSVNSYCDSVRDHSFPSKEESFQ